MAASFACMTAIVAILFSLQNKPSTWWTFYVSLNATIATLATAAKAALLMGVSSCLGQEKWLYFSRKSRRLQHLATIDEASRGPIGAVQMLAGIPWSLATLGAAVVILSLTTDAFVQQVIFLESNRTLVQGESATFGFTHSYDSGKLWTLQASTGAVPPTFRFQGKPKFNLLHLIAQAPWGRALLGFRELILMK